MENKSSTCHMTSEKRQNMTEQDAIVAAENELSVCRYIAECTRNSGMRAIHRKRCEWLSVLVGLAKKAIKVDAIVLPCKIGDDVYIIPSKVNFDLNVLANHKENNRVYHQKVANIVFEEDGWYMTGSADMEYGTGRILLDRFYKETWFLLKKEAEAALTKMDGGNEDGKIGEKVRQ